MVAVIELGQQTWLVAGIVPGLRRCPSKKLTGANKEEETLKLLLRWRDEAIRLGEEIKQSPSRSNLAATVSGWRDG
ncbi:MAG: hypothetical protein WCC41_03335 [Rhodomicrobium sp.]